VAISGQNETDHLPASSVEVKNEWSDTTTPTTGLHGQDMGNFICLSSKLAQYLYSAHHSRQNRVPQCDGSQNNLAETRTVSVREMRQLGSQ